MSSLGVQITGRRLAPPRRVHVVPRTGRAAGCPAFRCFGQAYPSPPAGAPFQTGRCRRSPSPAQPFAPSPALSSLRLPTPLPQPEHQLRLERRPAPRSHVVVGRYANSRQHQHRRRCRHPNQIRVDHHSYPPPVGLRNPQRSLSWRRTARRLFAPFCSASIPCRAAARRRRGAVRRAPRTVQRTFDPGYPVAQVVHIPA